MGHASLGPKEITFPTQIRHMVGRGASGRGCTRTWPPVARGAESHPPVPAVWLPVRGRSPWPGRPPAEGLRARRESVHDLHGRSPLIAGRAGPLRSRDDERHLPDEGRARQRRRVFPAPVDSMGGRLARARAGGSGQHAMGRPCRRGRARRAPPPAAEGQSLGPLGPLGPRAPLTRRDLI